ncbi:MAG: DUF3303 family protein [Candidatus Thorarchaeota archaeon]|jgi:hypothetical protein
MKYLCLFESVDAEEAYKRMLKLREIEKEYKKEDKKMKAETAYQYADLTGGFQIIETDDHDNLAQLAAWYYGATNFKIIPIIELGRLEEIYKETKPYW